MVEEGPSFLVPLLDLGRVDEDTFTGNSPADWGERVFGGQVAAQALVAAKRTVSVERRVHSLHAYFLRPGNPTEPIVYKVDRIRDGGSFTTRRVVASQAEGAIFSMSVSLQTREEGFFHQDQMPEVPDPESLPTNAERLEGIFDSLGNIPDDMRRRMLRPGPVDMRWCDGAVVARGQSRAPRGMVWMRIRETLPADPQLNTCCLVYASDFTLAETIMRPHAAHWVTGEVMVASLDHAMWFHDDLSADQWWLYVEDSPAAGGSRGLARGSIFSRDGRLVCSVAQEVLLRKIKPRN
ncbi:MAG: acyl-CoA thioesterase II [Deltaproteobacteria bacterium]